MRNLKKNILRIFVVTSKIYLVGKKKKKIAFPLFPFTFLKKKDNESLLIHILLPEIIGKLILLNFS